MISAQHIILLWNLLVAVVSLLLGRFQERRLGRRLRPEPLARRPLPRLRPRFGRHLGSQRAGPEGGRQGRRRGAGLLRRLESSGNGRSTREAWEHR